MGEHIDTRGQRRRKKTVESEDNLARKRRVTFKNYLREREEEELLEDLDLLDDPAADDAD